MMLASTPDQYRLEPLNELVASRSELVDRHHLFWSGPQMRFLGLSAFRGLPCAIRKGDSQIHSLVHIRFHQHGVRLSSTDQAHVFQTVATYAIRRHNEYQCSCRLPQRLITIDALTLQPLQSDQPPCLGYAIDRDLLSIMREFYQPVVQLGPDLPWLIEERCRSRRCACKLQNGHNPLRPLGWNWGLPQTA